MKRSGRINLLMILGILSVILIVLVVVFSSESPNEAGSRFMVALAKGDVDTLTEMTYLGKSRSKEDIRKQWEVATKIAAPHYLFTWTFTSTTQPNPDQANIKVQVNRNLDTNPFQEKFELPLYKVDGEWKVDVPAINRNMYPAMPR